ncbi:uncharacterized protein LOC144508360 [Mustelus asterias]
MWMGRCSCVSLSRGRRFCLGLLASIAAAWYLHKPLRTLIHRLRSSLLPRVNYKVKCYGRGKVHEAILKKLNISEREDGPGIPCILFVYKVSRDNEDLRNALQWATEHGSTRKEDIFVVFLLVKTSEKSKDVGEEKITGLDFFHQDTKVRVLWKETSGSQPDFSCPEAIRTVTEMISQRNVRNQDVRQRARNWFYIQSLGLGLGSILMLILARSVCQAAGTCHPWMQLPLPFPLPTIPPWCLHFRCFCPSFVCLH